MNDSALQALSDELNDCVSVEHVVGILRLALPGEENGHRRRELRRLWLAHHRERGAVLAALMLRKRVS